MAGLRLFVVGASSGNPDDWSDHNRRSIVLAESLEQALGMVEFSSVGAEISCDAPTVLCRDEPVDI
jgi:hypothetical protein